MRLIDADELKRVLSDKDYITYTHEFGDAIPFDWIINAIDNAPTITTSLKLENITEDDVKKFKMIWERSTSKGLPLISEDRPKGHWIKETNGYYIYFRCNNPNCNNFVANKTRYCSNCGADMRGTENE